MKPRFKIDIITYRPTFHFRYTTMPTPRKSGLTKRVRKQDHDRERYRSKRRSLQNLAYLPPARTWPPNITPFTPGSMDIMCQHCGALRFGKETLNCCHNGKVCLEQLSEYPAELRDLLKSNNFLDNVRAYNSGVAFSSMGAQLALPQGNENP